MFELKVQSAAKEQTSMPSTHWPKCAICYNFNFCSCALFGSKVALPLSVSHVMIVRRVAQVGRRKWETNAALGHWWVSPKPMLLLKLLDNSVTFPALVGVINSEFWTWLWHCCLLQVNIQTNGDQLQVSLEKKKLLAWVLTWLFVCFLIFWT